MHAIRQYEFGPADNLRYEETEDPVPGEGQVRIAVRAAGVHLIDTAIRQGESFGPAPLPDLPYIPGREVAGVVDAIGGGVRDDWLGRRVVTLLSAGSGGYAELAVADVTAVHGLPSTISFEAAVAMVGTGRTAMGILHAARLSRDDVMVVTAATGGLGSLIVQRGRNIKATVVALAGGPAKVERARELGASIAVDYGEPDWAKTVREALDGRDADVVFDGVGGPLGRGAFELLGTGGRAILYGGASTTGKPVEITSADLAAKGLTATWAVGPAMAKRHSLRTLEEEALKEGAAGRLVPDVQAFALRDVAQAHTALEARATSGKVVLIP